MALPNIASHFKPSPSATRPQTRITQPIRRTRQTPRTQPIRRTRPIPQRHRQGGPLSSARRIFSVRTRIFLCPQARCRAIFTSRYTRFTRWSCRLRISGSHVSPGMSVAHPSICFPGQPWGQTSRAPSSHCNSRGQVTCGTFCNRHHQAVCASRCTASAAHLIMSMSC